MTKLLTIPGKGPGAGLLVDVGDWVQLAEGDWHKVARYTKSTIWADDGFTMDPQSVVSVHLPSEHWE